MDQSFDFSRVLREHIQRHKSKPAQFVNVQGGVQKRVENSLKARKSNRLCVFDKIRNLSICESPITPVQKKDKVNDRKMQLEKWKQEKEKKKKEIASQKKKPFVVGTAKAPLKYVPPPPPKPVPSRSGCVTRSQSAKNRLKQAQELKSQAQKYTFAPKNATFCPPKIKNMDKLPVLAAVNTKKDKKLNLLSLTSSSGSDVELPSTSNNKSQAPSKKTPRKSGRKSTQKDKKQNKSLMCLSNSSSSEVEPPSNNMLEPPANSQIKAKTPRRSNRKSIDNRARCTPKNAIPKSESSSEERLRSPKSPGDVLELPMTPEQIAEEAKRISPCVTLSRGKDNARKEMKKKLDEGLLDEDASDIESVDYFRKQLSSEINRMTDMCITWERISEQTVLPDAVQECVLGAVGQARLLMSAKMQQFAGLVERCVRPEPGTALVTPADLHGFWDMIFMQVENVDMRFKKLEEMRSRGWCEEQPVKVSKKPAVKSKGAKPAVNTAQPSRLREMIAAARKAKKQQEQQEQVAVCVSVDSKTFEAGFFTVQSPVRSPACTTPNHRASLLKAVLSSEAKKASASKSASFAMLRASVFGKGVECDGIAPLPQTPVPNLQATPGRSILKQAESVKKSNKKSIKMVLFDQSDSENNSDSGLLNENNDREEDGQNIDGENGDGHNGDGQNGDGQKENSRRKSKLKRQDAVEVSPRMTRSRRKSLAEEETSRRSTRRSQVLQEIQIESGQKETTGRSRRRKTGPQVNT